MGVSTEVTGKTMKCMVLGYMTTETASSTKANTKTTKNKASASTLEKTRKSMRAGLSMERGTVYLYRRMPLRINRSRGFLNLGIKLCGSTNKQSSRSTLISTILKSIFSTLKVFNTFTKN